jgi:hypothetical protein
MSAPGSIQASASSTIPGKASSRPAAGEPREPFPSLSLPGAEWATLASPARRRAVPYVLPGAALALAAGALWWHGPVLQPADYHDFADQRAILGVPNAADVISNLGFALVGLLGLRRLARHWSAPVLAAGRDGWLLFFAALLLTSLGSAAYHLAPDNGRLVWDRLPIALACAGLLAANWRETIGVGRWVTPALLAWAVLGVAWWRFTDLHGRGDLRPYLLLQLLPVVLLPLLQWQHETRMPERLAVGGAMCLYLLAKVFEWADHAVFQSLTVVSGHTIKHVLATLAAALIGWALSWRVARAASGSCTKAVSGCGDRQ